MSSRITRIPLGSGAMSVNAYLVQTDAGAVLVDTGMRRHRTELETRLSALPAEGPGRLLLILITHGDVDHIGNAAHLRRVFGVPIAMNGGDIGMTRDGDMFSGRTPPNRLTRALLSKAIRVPEEDRFEPDVLLDEATELAQFGLAEARVLVLEGHSSGSIALLFDDGSLICGDLLENRSSPKIGSIMDDVPAAEGSVARLKALEIGTVYPGHGSPFAFEQLGKG